MADTVEVEPGVKKDKPSPSKPESGSDDAGSEEKSSGQASPELNGSKTGEGSPDPESKEPSTSPVETTDSDVQMSEPEAKETPSPVDSGGRMSDSPEGPKESETKDKQPDAPSDGESTVLEDDSDSEDSEVSELVNEIYKAELAKISDTGLEKYLEDIGKEILKSGYTSDDDIYSSDGGSETDVIDKESGKDPSLSVPILKDLKNRLGNILDNANRLYSSTKDKPRLERIISHLTLIEKDMREFARETFPTIENISDVKNLATVVRYISEKAQANVSVGQIQEEIDVERVMSHYRGFSCFRREELLDLNRAHSQLKKSVAKWDSFWPYLRVYMEETYALKDMRWKIVEMAVSEMKDWKAGLEELVKTENNLYLLLKVIVRDIEVAFYDFCSVQKCLIFNLNSFLNVDIRNLFEVPSSLKCR